ncbi:MAG: hypothetical protein LBG15_01660 [Dysgonamonadaceae bacterium]|jgi:hypothetical protein|nr:hypothetical protein [Dysgonamonadaceae bacterium]
MKDNCVYNALLNEIRKKIPQNSKLVNKLVDILYIEKEAVYRRLRREVPFTFQEIVILSKQLGISLDYIMEIDSHKKRSFQLKLIEYMNPCEIDYSMIQDYVNIIQNSKNKTATETGVVSNILPQTLYSGFKLISKFYIFKWHYHYDYNRIKPFHEMIVPERISNLFTDNYIESKNIFDTSYILDSLIIQNLVNDIKYFNSIRLIKKDDVVLIKEELIRFVDYLEAIATDGYFKETKNKVQIYISNINIDTNYTYLNTPNYKLSMIWTFILTSTISMDIKTFNIIKNWFWSIIRNSTLITITGEKERILFFETQRKIIEEL